MPKRKWLQKFLFTFEPSDVTRVVWKRWVWLRCKFSSSSSWGQLWSHSHNHVQRMIIVKKKKRTINSGSLGATHCTDLHRNMLSQVATLVHPGPQDSVVWGSGNSPQRSMNHTKRKTKCKTIFYFEVAKLCAWIYVCTPPAQPALGVASMCCPKSGQKATHPSIDHFAHLPGLWFELDTRKFSNRNFQIEKNKK